MQIFCQIAVCPCQRLPAGLGSTLQAKRSDLVTVELLPQNWSSLKRFKGELITL